MSDALDDVLRKVWMDAASEPEPGRDESDGRGVDGPASDVALH